MVKLGNNPAVMAASVAAVVVIGIIFFLKTTSGKAVGENVAGVVTGFAGGITSSVVAVASNPDVNPLHGLGSAIGGGIYDIFH